jgi:hypothetical protein
MTDRITRQARRALRRAWAVEYDITNFADCQFLGILGESTCVAARTLARLGLDLRQARRDALEIARGRSATPAGQVAAVAGGKGWLRAPALHEQFVDRMIRASLLGKAHLAVPSYW